MSRRTETVAFAWFLPDEGNREKHAANLTAAMTALNDVTPIRGFLLRIGFTTVAGRPVMLSYPHVSIDQVYEATRMIETLSSAFNYRTC